MFYTDNNKNFKASMEKIDSTIHITDTFDVSNIAHENGSKNSYKFSELIQSTNTSPILTKFRSITKNLKHKAYIQQSYTQDNYEIKGSPTGSSRKNHLERDQEMDDFLLGDNNISHFNSNGDYSR